MKSALWEDGHLVLVERAATERIDAVLRHELRWNPSVSTQAVRISETHHVGQPPFGDDVDLGASWVSVRSVESAGTDETDGHGYPCPDTRWEGFS